MIKLQSDDAASRDSVEKAAERSLMAKMFMQEEKSDMGIQGLIIFLLIGAVAGWLAGVIMKGYGFGLIGNIVVGIVGAFIAGLVLPMVGVAIGGGILGSIIHATIGAVILLFIVGLVRRA
jgi:uncharacterized membrane protein YeaQ/YmgE (transglycosylase-associated protein family)